MLPCRLREGAEGRGAEQPQRVGSPSLGPSALPGSRQLLREQPLPPQPLPPPPALNFPPAPRCPFAAAVSEALRPQGLRAAAVPLRPLWGCRRGRPRPPAPPSLPGPPPAPAPPPRRRRRICGPRPAASAVWAVVREKQDGGGGGGGGHGAAGPAGADAGEQRGAQQNQGRVASSCFFGTRRTRESGGRLVAGLVAEFLRFFNLDFTLAVFQPESSTLNGLDGRENLARDLGITEAEGSVGGPLLLEVVKKCQQKKISGSGEIAPVLSDSLCSTSKSSDGRSNTHPIPSKVAESTQSDTSVSSGEASKRSIHFLPNETKLDPQLQNKDLNTKEKSDPGMDEDDEEGDSFFDDPIPKPERTYGWKTESNKAGSLASLSDAPPLKSGLSSLTGAPLLKEPDDLNRNSVLKDLRLVNAKLGSLELGNGDDDDYADDFNSTSHRSEKSDISIGEEIDEISVETEDLNASDKLEDITQDHTISQLSDVADYLEDVA